MLSGIATLAPAPSRTCITLEEYQQLQRELGVASTAAAAATATARPRTFDWRNSGWVTRVGFQGKCRASWAFAAAAAIETLWAAKSRVLVDLSPQAFLDCQKTPGFNGCQGEPAVGGGGGVCLFSVSRAARRRECFVLV